MPPPATQGVTLPMPGTPSAVAAARGDASSHCFQSPIPYELLYEPPVAASSPMGDRYASPIPQANTPRVSDVLGYRRPTRPEQYLSAGFTWELFSPGLQRPGDPSQSGSESSRLSPGDGETAAAPPVAMPNPASRVWDHGSPQPMPQRRPMLHPASTTQPRYLEPPSVPQYTWPSHPTREQRGLFSLPSRHGSRGAGGMQASSSTGGGCCSDRVALDPSATNLVGAVRSTLASPLARSSVVGVACMGANATAPAQHLDTVTTMTSGGPYPSSRGRGCLWNRQSAEPSFQHPMHQTTAAAATTNAHQRASEHGWLLAQSQVSVPDRFAELRRSGSDLVGWPYFSSHEAESDSRGVYNFDSEVRETVQRSCRVCGRVYGPLDRALASLWSRVPRPLC